MWKWAETEYIKIADSKSQSREKAGNDMKYFVTAEEMKQCDKYTIETIGIPSLVLMERAALAVLSEWKNRKINISAPLIVCGVGNNGGDGAALARLLFCMGSDVTLVIVGNLEKATKEFLTNLKIAENLGIKWYSDIPHKEYTIVADAIFGVGLSRAVEGEFLAKIKQMNQISAPHCAIDLPSGVHADTGQIMGGAFLADFTVTFAFYKVGMAFYPARSYCGEVMVKDVGIMAHDLTTEHLGGLGAEREDIKRLLPKRRPDSNKGTYGKLLLVMGSKNMAGAAVMAARAAYASGCGYVRILTAEENRSILQQQVPEAVLSTYSKKHSGKELKVIVKEAMEGVTAVGIGSGLSTGKQAEQLLEIVLKTVKVPLLLDADALNLLAKWNFLGERNPEGIPIVMTPHLGELSRLSGETISKIKQDPAAFAKWFSKEHQITLVQKEATTIVAAPGKRMYVNLTGNPGMSTAGSGDVLAGLLSGFLAQRMEAWEAGVLAVCLHGMAGDLAAEKKSEISMTALDLADQLSKAVLLCMES